MYGTCCYLSHSNNSCGYEKNGLTQSSTEKGGQLGSPLVFLKKGEIMRSYPWRKNTMGKNVSSQKRLKNHNSRRVANTRIDHLRCLIGRKVEIDVPTDTGTSKRIVTISNLYPHMALCTYLVGKEGPKTELKIGLSVSDLVTLGLIDFRIGKAEVIA